MDRKGKLSGAFLICISLLVSSCSQLEQRAEVMVRLTCSETVTRALAADEEMISNVCLMIFDSTGHLEYSSYTTDSGSCRISLLKGERYSFYAFANFGYKIRAVTLEELKQTEYHLAYPDEYRSGLPMYAASDITITDDDIVELELERLMSRISIRMDRSRLSEGISLKVSSVRIGNCPKKTRVLAKNRVESIDDCFITGFSHKGDECIPLNTEDRNRMSEEISLYMFENMQGQFSDTPIGSDEEKVFEEYDRRRQTCSFVEIGLEYSSEEWTSSEAPLIYRFYLGDDRNSLDIERNCHYHITICPEDDGLKGDGWRIDKSGLEYTGSTSLVKYPSEYITGDIGDKIHLGCRLTPSSAPFDIGIEYLEADKSEGIYDYEIDTDGHGVTLTLTGPGRGLIYMEAGSPINEAALFMIEVNLPD